MEEEWTVSANDALKIALVRPTTAGLEKIETFEPRFTYPIFGEDETIFGYKGLKVNLFYDARDLRPHLQVSHTKKFNAVGDVEALDVRETLKEFLPGVAFQSKPDYEKALKDIPADWTPPGSLVKSVEKNGETYETWRGSMADPAVKQMVRRIQATALFFIEGGSYIGVDADGEEEPETSLARWTVFFVYKKQAMPEEADKTQYTFQGFATVYDFWMFQQPSPPSSPRQKATPIQPKTADSWELPHGDFSLKEVPRRVRISQFIILPPFQGKGIGALLYNTIFDIYMRDSWTKEITVEDPNEEFDLLRDLCDMKYLRKNMPEFSALRVNNSVALPVKGGILHNNTQVSSSSSATSTAGGIVDVEALETMRHKAKIAPRQFWRLVEMHLMSTLPDSVRPRTDTDEPKPAASQADQHIYTLWRLLLKQRLYRRNASILSEFEITERIIKLNDTVISVEWEYAKILDRLEPAPAAANGKRKATADAERDTLVKKARVAPIEEAEEVDA
ncbi:histone acetyl transferase HAT1-like protein [Xylariomycetidae sp. FL0641]|nr:histone acetyl transferase HAT1-like protein [Xylariomycetidae sp. FL0641]